MNNDPKELYKRFPMKYTKNGGDGHEKKLGAIVSELRAMIDDNKTGEELADYIDDEFLFGAWGYWSKNLPDTMLNEIRGVIIAMYRMEK